MASVIFVQFCFAFFFFFFLDGRWNCSSFSTSPTWKYLGPCFPFQTKRSRHVLGINVFAASTPLTPTLGKACHQSRKLHTPNPVPGLWGSLMPWRAVARCFCTFPAWKWRVTRPGSCYEKKTSLTFSVPQRSRTGFLNWNHPSLASRCLRGYMTSAAICVLTATLVAVSSTHAELIPRAYFKLMTQSGNWVAGPEMILNQQAHRELFGFYVLLDFGLPGIAWGAFFFFSFFVLYLVGLVLNVGNKSKRLSHWLLPLPQASPNFYAHILLNKAGAPWNLWDLSEAFEAEYRVVSSPSLIFLVVGMFHLYYRFFLLLMCSAVFKCELVRKCADSMFLLQIK